VTKKPKDTRPRVRLIIAMHGGTIDHVLTDNPDVNITDVVFTERPEEAEFYEGENEFFVEGGKLAGEMIYTRQRQVAVADPKTIRATFKAAKARSTFRNKEQMQ